MTLTCRDRNRIVLEQELTGLREVGVDAVLCVTGDARAYDVRPDVTQVFDLDGTRLAALAASVGVTAAVVETPTAPPRHAAGVPAGYQATGRGGGRGAQPRRGADLRGRIHGGGRAGRG
jgi:methylenetetrahydrofolate reductase (NADPH)